MGKKKAEQDLTIKQIKAIKSLAEDAINKILDQLEQDTGLVVDRVDYYDGEDVVIYLQTGLD
jgi:hypothetical protein